jgi:hypothetical protein
MPEKRSMTSTFLKHIEDNNMKYNILLLNEEDLLGPILDDKTESKKLFEDLKEMKITLYEIYKI